MLPCSLGSAIKKKMQPLFVAQISWFQRPPGLAIEIEEIPVQFFA